LDARFAVSILGEGLGSLWSEHFRGKRKKNREEEDDFEESVQKQICRNRVGVNTGEILPPSRCKLNNKISRWKAARKLPAAVLLGRLPGSVTSSRWSVQITDYSCSTGMRCHLGVTRAMKDEKEAWVSS